MKVFRFFLFFTLCLFGATHATAVEELISKAIWAINTNQNTSEQTDGTIWIQVLTHEEVDIEMSLMEKDMAQKIKNNPQIQAFTRIHTSNFNPGSRYTLYLVNAEMEETEYASYTANKAGELISIEGNFPLNKSLMIANGMMKGEAAYYVLVSADQKHIAATSFTPYPIEFRWSDGAKISIHVASSDATVFKIFGSGFKPNEEFTIVSRSGSEIGKSPWKVKEDGLFFTLLAPATIGSDGGKASFSIIRKGFPENGTLKYSWGTVARLKPAPL